MAFFQLLLKANKLEKACKKYEEEKLISIDVSKGAKRHLTLGQRIRRRKLRCKRWIKDFLNRITTFPEDSWLHEKAVLLRTDGSFENYVLKSVVGFFGGVFFTYFLFMFFVLQLHFTLTSSTLICSILGIILTLGLAFSFQVRCIVFLILPQFFSKRGRQALIAYAFILTLSGPAKNTLHNINVLSESLMCGQEQLKQAIKAVVQMIKQPYYALKEAVTKVVKMVKRVVKRIKETLIAIKRLILSILKVVTAVFQWLGSIVNICNKKLGTPFDRCQRVFEGAVADCRAKLGPVFAGICNITYVVSALCYIVKPLDFICMLVSYVTDAIVGSVKKKIKKFTMHMKTMFYVKVKFSHSFHMETNQSTSIEAISTSISTEMRSRTKKFSAFFDFVSFLTSFFVLFMLLRVLRYHQKWLTSERFDNQYLTKDLRTIDLIRTRQKKETILPLNRREKNRYISLSSVTLIRSEKIKLARSVVFLGLTTFKICIHIMADYSLYWILSTIRYYGRMETKVQQPNAVGIYVSGDGYLAELYRSIVRSFSPKIQEMQLNAMECLPDPMPPDFDRYIQILMLILFCWLMAIFEPYSLRLRQVVMCHYYPDRAKQRAAWLYNHIIRSRGSFLKFARRQLRRKFGIAREEAIEKVTLKERFAAKCPLYGKLFGRKEAACLLCGAVQRDENNPHVKCPSPGCVGLFCTECFAELQNICTICRSPLEYGDLTDMSEEFDSSDDEARRRKKKERKMREELRIAREKKAEEPTVTEEEPKIKEPLVPKDTEKAEESDKDLDESSSYSYSYQEEERPSPREMELYQRRAPFKDVEAQRIRDDVTIQIFNEPLVKESSVSSDSDASTSCFVVRAHRKVRGKVKKKGKSESSESTSGEEVNEDEVIHIEVEKGCDESLERGSKGRVRKYSRIRRIVSAIARIPWLGKKSSEKREGLQWQRPSLLNKVASMLNRRGNLPIQTYRRVRTKKSDEDDEEESCTSSSSSSSSSAASFNENEDDRSRLIARSRSKGSRKRKKKSRSLRDLEDPEDIIYLKGDTSRRRRRRIQGNDEDVNLRYPHEKKFTTKQLPRYLEATSKKTSYYEVDEMKDSPLSSARVQHEDNMNVLSDAKIHSHARKRDKWNIISEDQRKREEESKKKGTRRKTKKGHEVLQISDPTAGLELYGVKDEPVKLREQYEERATKEDIERKDAKDSPKGTTVQRKSKDKKKCRSSKHKKHQKRIKDRYYEKREKKHRGRESKGTRKRKRRGRRRSSSSSLEKSLISDKQLHSESPESYYEPSTRREQYRKSTHDEALQFPEKEQKDEYTITKPTHDCYCSRERRRQLMSVFQRACPAHLRHHKRYPSPCERSHREARYFVCRHRVPPCRMFAPRICYCNKNVRREVRERSGGEGPMHELPRNVSRLHEVRENYYERSEKDHLQYEEVVEAPQTNRKNRRESTSCHEERAAKLKFQKRDPRHCEKTDTGGTRAFTHRRFDLIEELKEHKRMKLIREREARRCATLNVVPISPVNVERKSEFYSDTFVECTPRLRPLRQAKRNEKLPYQETRAFEEVTKEFVKRAKPTKGGDKIEETVPLISMSRDADRTNEVQQLFPAHKFMSNLTNKMLNAFKSTDKKRIARSQRRRLERKRSFTEESLSEMSSLIHESSSRRHHFDVSSSADDTTDNNAAI